MCQWLMNEKGFMSNWEIDKTSRMATHASGLRIEMSHQGEAIDLHIPKGLPARDIRRLTLEAEQEWKSAGSAAGARAAEARPDPARVKPAEGPRKSTLSLKLRKKEL